MKALICWLLFSPAQIDSAVALLGNDNYHVREAATTYLIWCPSIIPFNDYAPIHDLEVARRLVWINETRLSYATYGHPTTRKK